MVDLISLIPDKEKQDMYYKSVLNEQNSIYPVLLHSKRCW